MIDFRIISALSFIVFAPFVGGFLEGLDRKISARMQRRVGPSVFQPFYDVIKLLSKETIAVTASQRFLLVSYMILTVFTGAMFFFGSDLLMVFLMLSTAGVFLYLAGCVTSSPYSSMGAQRELMQELSYEPALLLTGLGFYIAEGTFRVQDIVNSRYSAVMFLPGFFVAFVFILTIKMRKSPFDESTSHHPHQELVKGLTTEMGSTNLAIFQITEWYENVLMLGVVALFIINSSVYSIPIAIIVVLFTYFLEILIDNTSARVKQSKMLFMAWSVTLVSAGVNMIIIMLIR